MSSPKVHLIGRERMAGYLPHQTRIPLSAGGAQPVQVRRGPKVLAEPVVHGRAPTPDATSIPTPAPGACRITKYKQRSSSAKVLSIIGSHYTQRTYLFVLRMREQ
jgi:hypothetical protein